MSDRFYEHQKNRKNIKMTTTIEHLSMTFTIPEEKPLPGHEGKLPLTSTVVKTEEPKEPDEDPYARSAPVHVPTPKPQSDIMNKMFPELNKEEYNVPPEGLQGAIMNKKSPEKQKAEEFFPNLPTPPPEIKPEKEESVSPPAEERKAEWQVVEMPEEPEIPEIKPVESVSPQVKKERGLEYDEYPQMAAVINPYPGRYVSDEELDLPPEEPIFDTSKGSIGEQMLVVTHEIFDTVITLERSFNEILMEQMLEKIATEQLDNLTTDPKRYLRLYEISPLIEQAVYEATDYAEKHDGELPFELTDLIDRLEMDREEKLLNCGLLYKDYVSQHEALETELKKLRTRALVYKKKAESIKQYINANIREREVIKDPRITWSWKKSTKCVITDIDKLPEGTFTIERKPLIDTCIKPLLKDGTSIVPGAELVESINLSIK